MPNASANDSPERASEQFQEKEKRKARNGAPQKPQNREGQTEKRGGTHKRNAAIGAKNKITVVAN